GTGVRYQNNANTDWEVGDGRFGRPWKPDILGPYQQAGESFNPNAHYEFKGSTFYRDGKLLYVYDPDWVYEQSITLRMGYNEAPDMNPGNRPVLPTTPVGIVKYRLSLDPGESLELDFRFPYLSMESDAQNLDWVLNAKHAKIRRKVLKGWDQIIEDGLQIKTAEAKVNETFKASLVYDLIARDKVGDQSVQKVNEFQYDAFWLRDAAFIANMYLISGYDDYAREVLDFFPQWQQEDGNFVSHGGQYDGFGQVLWIYGQYYRYTRDEQFAGRVFPSILEAVDWFDQVRSTDEYRLIPPTTPGDNEQITGRVTGHNLWALHGLIGAAEIAAALGDSKAHARLKALYTDHKENTDIAIARLADANANYVPPGLDGPGGQDWGNLLLSFPEQIYPPDHPYVTGTLDRARSKYQEGLMTYDDGRYLHHYLTIRNTQTALLRNEQEQALQEFYAVLLHTSSTHAGFEFSIPPWGSRDFGMNLSPHGWFAAEFRTLLRNMLIREEAEDLVLFSCLSPEWLQPGTELKVEDATSSFGSSNIFIKNEMQLSNIRLKNKFHTNPKNISLMIPFFMEVSSIVADGDIYLAEGGVVKLPHDTKSITISWKPKPKARHYSYYLAVENYKAEYRQRYQKYLQTGSPF
ncbi:MAG: hypothetical protein K9M49_10180, partial [Candidatus Marinimicrobia bacterium]|nr:hypothetical protein [Candidatus Neomarinimicrobiota bacterium]